MTTNLRSNVTVTLPATLDKFSEIEWCVVTTNFIPVLFFSDNVIWVYGQSGEAHKAIDNAFIVYKFQTWDNGAHWLAQRKLYSENYNNYEGIIDEDYLNTWIKDSDDEVTGYWIQSFEYDEESGTGEIEIVLE